MHERLVGLVPSVQELNAKMEVLEHTVKRQAEKLAEFEKRSSRNNRLVFGAEEGILESGSDVKVAVVDNVYISQETERTSSNNRNNSPIRQATAGAY